MHVTGIQNRRIIFVITRLSYGGAAGQLVRIAVKLKARGWEPYVVSMLPPHAYIDELSNHNIQLLELNISHIKTMPLAVARMIRIIKKIRPEIVHGFLYHANLLIRLVRFFTRIPVLITSVRSLYEGGRLSEIGYKITDRCADITTQVSIAGLERYIRRGIVSPTRIRMIPNGVDTEKFKPNQELNRRMRRELSLDEAFTWLAVGRLHESKDYPMLLDAFHTISKKHHNSVLLIVGDGPERNILNDKIQTLGLEDNVRLLGNRKDVAALMNAADAYVMSSRWEGMANVLLEASSSECPVIATDVGGNREVVVDGETGKIIPSANHDALVSAMLVFMESDPSFRKSLGAAGRSYILKNFTLEEIVKAWENLYMELIRKKRVA